MTISRRRFIQHGALALVLAPRAAAAQETRRPRLIGMLRSGAPQTTTANLDALRDGLRRLGYVEGRDVVFEYRFPQRPEDDGPLENAIALVRMNVDVIHAAGPRAVEAARKATTTVPIVGHDFETDPVAAGFARSLARPGGNITGIFLDLPELTGKHLQLLKAVAPSIARVAIVWDPSTGPALRIAAGKSAGSLGLEPTLIEAGSFQEIERGLRAFTGRRAAGVLILSSPAFSGAVQQPLAALALKSRLPSVMLFQSFARAGGLMAYGPDQPELYRQEARLLAKIMDGTAPGDVPIERPTKFELLLNTKTAKALGLTIPPALLLQADHVIE